MTKRIHSHRRISLLLAIFMLLTSTFASIAPSLAESASAQPLCLDGKVWSDEEEACVDIEETEPTVESEPTEEDIAEPADGPVDGEDEDIEAPTAEMTEAPDAAFATTSLTITTLFCNEVVNEAVVQLGAFEYNCKYSPGVSTPFTVSVGGQTVASGDTQQIGASGSYILDVPSVPEGDVTISQGTTPGYLPNPVVYCIVIDDLGTVREMARYPASNGTVVLESLPRGTRAWCEFYQLPSQSSVVLDVKSYACPQAVADAAFVSYEDLLAQCSAPAPDTEVLATSGNGVDTTYTSSGVATFAGLPEGDIEIRQVIPEGFGAPFAFCTVTGTNGQTLKTRDLEILYDDYTVRVTNLISPSRALCEFFNVPGELAATDTAIGEPDAALGSSSIVIHMLFCNELGEVTTIEMSYLEENCPLLPGVGASFTVSVAGQTIASGNAELLGPAGPYGLDVPGVPEGDVTINQGATPGFVSALVYCIVKDDTNAVVRDWTPYPFSEGAVVVESLPGGTRTWCNFFQIPAPDEITFSVQTYACPQAVADAGFTSYEDLRLKCVVPSEEIEIQFAANDVPSQVTTSAGFVSFADLPPGDILVRELIPEGYGAPYAFCTITGPNGQTLKSRDLEILYDDYTVRLDDLVAPASASCEFFNVPGELVEVGTAAAGADDVPGDVAISKYLCPGAFSYADWTAEKFATECTEPLPGIIFRLDQNGAAVTNGTSDAGGKVVLTTTQPITGAFQIVEEIPDEYTNAITYCAPEPEEGEDSQPGTLKVTVSGAITIENAGAGVDCAWYNTLVGGGDRTATLSVAAFGCPDGTDPASTDPLTYVLECSAPMPGLTIDVSETANSGQTKETPQTAPTSVFFDQLPDYQILVSPERPAEYLRPVAFCLVEDANGTVVMPLQRMTVDKFTEFPITLGVGGKGTCELYYVPGRVTNLIVFKSICPDPDTGVVRTREEWFALCNPTPGAGFEFSVSQAGEETQTAITGEYSSGGAFFTDLEPGPVTLTETIPSAYGTPLVWCYDYLPDVQGPTEYVQQTVVNGSIEYTTVAGQERHCYWLNQPVATGIDIWKSICPPGIDISTATYNTFSSACRTDASGIPFTVSDGISVLATQKVGETYANRVVFPAYPGPVTISESIPAEYGQPVVYCTTADPAMAPESVWQRMTLVSDGSIALAPAPAGSIWTCSWFNIPTDNGHIEIHKWQCPPEVDPRAELAELLTKCSAPMNDVTFISDGDAATAKETVNGIVRFEVPDSGGFRVEERIPEGYGYPVVFCSFAGGAGMEMNFPERYELEGGDTISGTIPYAGFEMYCDWFNIPKKPGDITINKWTCPEGYDLHGYAADPKRDCTEATDGIAFSIEGEGFQSQTATGDSVAGAAYWGDLEPGEYVVTELVPEGIASHFVLDCSGGRVNGIQSYPLTDDDHITVLLADGDRIVCNWYNVPESEWGWVTVTKYWCTTATFVSDVDCEIYEEGVSFELRDDEGGTAGSGTTSEYGTVSFDELEPGSYSLDEVGYDWCAIDVSGDGDAIVVTSGEETSVAVFNCSIDPPAGGKQVPTKYPNTGVEPAKTPAPRDESVISR